MADADLGRSLASVDIASATINCRRSLERCTCFRSLNNDRWAENRLADFNVWDAGLGASSSRRASLEDRLALKTHVRTAVLNLLILYCNAIKVVEELGRLHDKHEESSTDSVHVPATNPRTEPETVQSQHPNEELIVDDSTLPEAIETADVVLNNLARLAALIRKAGTTSRLSRADATFNPQMQQHEELRRHLYQILLCQPSALEDRRHAHWNSIDASVTDIPIEERDDYWQRIEQETVDFSFFGHKITEIQERLIVANLLRSHRFAYSQRHGSKLEYSSRQFEPAPYMHGQAQTGSSAESPMCTLDMPSDSKPGNPNEPARMYTDHTGTPKSGAENMTDTVASEVETVIMKEVAKSPTPSQQAVTEISTTGSRLRYPKPPRFNLGLTLFTCPCCCVPLPKIFAGSQRWRKHLKEDILPYTCVLPRCPKPATLFAEKSAWLDHMLNDHVPSASWVCAICGDGETYTVESDFIGHLISIHPGAIASDQITLFSEMCYKRTSEEITSCPLCSWTENAEGYVTHEQVLEHVAEHVHEFSLRSLPWAPNKSEENSKTFADACAKVEKWWAVCFPDQQGSGYVPKMPTSQDDRDSDPYFFTHEYFAESSGPSSLDAVSSGDRSLSDGSNDSIETLNEAEHHLDSMKTNVERTTSKLCALCDRMLSNWEEYEMNAVHKFPHHENPSGLQTSASALGCALCHQFYRGHTNRNDIPKTGIYGQVSIRAVSRDQIQGPPMEKEFNLSLAFKHQRMDMDSKFYPDYMYSTVKMLPAKHERSFPHGTNTKDSLNLAAKWLHECLKSHPECIQRPNLSSLPTRLIAIDETEIRLCDAMDIPADSQYATLSYCWGTGVPLSLTRASMEHLRRGMHMDTLPRTVQEAIYVAQCTDISYLWVDSLCIVQDDVEDWRHEGSRIPTVFGGSSLNIAATGARDSLEGCFFDRPENFVCRANVLTKGLASPHDFVSDDYLSEVLRDQPLSTRAWTLQERLLPPRNLHFTKTEVYWECNHYSASETFPAGIPRALMKAETFEKKPLDKTMWSWIVEEYTSRSLTHYEDKAVAISGIAQKIHQKCGDEYVAGMWHTDLAIQLCWFIDDTTQDRFPMYIAPTWSWLSTLGRVSYPRSNPSYRSGNELIWISKLEHQLQFHSTDIFGMITAGSLLLTCNLLLGVELQPGGMLFPNNRKELKCAIYLDTSSKPSHEIHALPVLSLQNGSLVQGLLLECVERKLEVYQRLGLFKCYGEDAVHRFEEAASKSLSQEDSENVQIVLL